MGTCSSTCTDKNQPRSAKEEPGSPSDTQPLSPELSSGDASSAPCVCPPSSAPSGSTPTPLVMRAPGLSYTAAFTSVGPDTTLPLVFFKCSTFKGVNGCRWHSPVTAAAVPQLLTEGSFSFCLQEFCARKSKWQRTGEGSPKSSTQLSLCPTRTNPMAMITMPSLTVSKAKAHH